MLISFLLTKRGISGYNTLEDDRSSSSEKKLKNARRNVLNPTSHFDRAMALIVGHAIRGGPREPFRVRTVRLLPDHRTVEIVAKRPAHQAARELAAKAKGNG